MKFFLIIATIFLSTILVDAQEYRPLDTIPFHEFSLDKYYGYVSAFSGNYLLVIGGSIEEEASDYILRDIPNTHFILIDQYKKEVTQYDVWSFPNEIAEQLSSTYMNYFQEDSLLYLVGGYGYSESFNAVITFPSMMVLDVDNIVESLLNAQSTEPYVRQICDKRFAVMDGYLDKVNDSFFVIEGRAAYKIQPRENDSFFYVESFDNQIRTFRIKDDGMNMELLDYQVWTDLDAFYEAFEDLIPSMILDGNDYRFKQWPQ